MKTLYLPLIILLFNSVVFSQDSFDRDNDGSIEFNTAQKHYDYDGDGILDTKIPIFNFKNETSFVKTPSQLNFYQYWVSTAGAFTNCWDGAIGYFDNDTLLDIAGYTFSPSKFYIWEQVASKPDSFALVYEYTKSEGGGFGPIVFGDTDGDGLTEIIVADLSTMTRIYVFENTGDNAYESKNTQSTLTHTNDGETGRYLYIADLNKNGKKEIICGRGSTSGGMIRIWEQSGVQGQHTYTNIYSYTTPTYIFSQGGLGDSDNNGYDEIFVTYGGAAIYNTYIRRIQFDSATSSFVHLMYQSNAVGMPASYRVADVNNDGVKELIATQNSNSKAALYIQRYNGNNTYKIIDSVFETADNNNLLTQDIKLLQGDVYPSIVTGSFNGKVYIYKYDGSIYSKTFEKLDYPGAAIRRVYWTLLSGVDGYFNTWSSSSSDGLFYIFKKQQEVGISNNNQIINKFKLVSIYPNPFNPTTRIKYQIAKNGFVTLKIYDILGKEVATLVDGNLKAGTYVTQFSINSITNYQIPSGLYFCKLKADNFSETRKIVLLK
ncbi:MAG: FG-GAP-like repeat-containing protein [Ignavibacteriae bacterium]|nr:FG-GAP-like repeat-containing protein [Ignavibacteriota bacterium]